MEGEEKSNLVHYSHVKISVNSEINEGGGEESEKGVTPTPEIKGGALLGLRSDILWVIMGTNMEELYRGQVFGRFPCASLLGGGPAGAQCFLTIFLKEAEGKKIEFSFESLLESYPYEKKTLDLPSFTQGKKGYRKVTWKKRFEGSVRSSVINLWEIFCISICRERGQQRWFWPDS